MPGTVLQFPRRQPAPMALAATLEFAKNSGTAQVFGEKVWMLLSVDGNPVRVLTPSQASAASRAGQVTTWVKRFW